MGKFPCSQDKLGMVHNPLKESTNSDRINRVAVPFPGVTLEAVRPNPEYPNLPKTIGEHIRRKRVGLRLLQKDVSKIMGTNTATITNWELEYSEPEICLMPAIISFLGYLPFEIGETLPEKLLVFRKIMGFS